MSEASKMHLQSFALAAVVFVGLCNLILLRWKSEKRYLDNYLDREETSFALKLLEATMPEPDARANRATAIALAAMSFRGENIDVDLLLNLADEFLQYIEGDDTAPIPRPDKAVKGSLPKPR